MSVAPTPNLFKRIVRENDIRHVSNLLGNIVDFDESIQEETMVIRSGVSEILDCARSRYEDLDNVSGLEFSGRLLTVIANSSHMSGLD